MPDLERSTLFEDDYQPGVYDIIDTTMATRKDPFSIEIDEFYVNPPCTITVDKIEVPHTSIMKINVIPQRHLFFVKNGNYFGLESDICWRKPCSSVSLFSKKHGGHSDYSGRWGNFFFEFGGLPGKRKIWNVICTCLFCIITSN